MSEATTPIAARAGSPSGVARRLPAPWLFAAYALVFAGFALLLDLSWAELSPVQTFATVDARAPRLVLTRWDSPSAHLSATASAEGVHLWGSGFRGAGAGLAVESSMIEAPCPLELPHVHPKQPPAEELVVAFEAKSALPGASLAAAVTQIEAARGRPRARFAPQVPLSPEWQAIELPLREMHPPGPNGFYPRAISALVLRGFPPAVLDLWLRHVRVLRVPIRAAPQ